MFKEKGKRTADMAFKGNIKEDGLKPQSPFVPMFEQLRDELDEHHDRRERTIKASRDITAASKKIIFSLQRIRELGRPIPDHIQKGNQKQRDMIKTLYKTIAPDLQGINSYRYSHNITGGNQEYMEALTFQHYLETQQLIPFKEAAAKLAEMSTQDAHIILTTSDYLLGVFDMVGELMRFSITTMAMTGQIPTGISDVDKVVVPQTSRVEMDSCDNINGQPSRNVLTDLRELRTYLESLDASGSSVARDMGKKMGIMRECVEKVEKASYGQVVRGSERPKGWMPDLGERGREEIEGY